MTQKQAGRGPTREVGDGIVGLEIDHDKDVRRDTDDVGEVAMVTPYASESLTDYRGERGKVVGTIVKHGVTYGYVVDVDGKTLYGSKKDFFVGRWMLEDIHPPTAFELRVRHALRHWSSQRDYYGSSWDGIECFHFELAKAVENVGVESAGWYSYPSSKRKDMDGKDWRLICSGHPGHVAVNCHSLLHDNAWTLNTTIFSTREIDTAGVKMVGHHDHWVRTLLWTREVAMALQTHGYRYDEALVDLNWRLNQVPRMHQIKMKLMPALAEACKSVAGVDPPQEYVSIGLSKIRLRPFSVGTHDPMTDERRYSVITVRPDIASDSRMLPIVIAHELIHWAIGRKPSEDPHGEVFQRVAERMGIPPKYRD